MSILVTNDDGVNSEGLWTLVKGLKEIAPVTVVAPSREQSAIGTAVSLRQTVKVRKIEPAVPGVEAFAVDGTPSDSVILALGKLVSSRVDLVVSGINQGTNLGEDVHISGTVGAALQAYLRGFPAIAVSAAYKDGSREEVAAKVVAALAKMVISNHALSDVFLNVNLPDLPLAAIKGVRITRLANESHVNTVEESATNGHEKVYRLVRQGLSGGANHGSDVWAVENGIISITPLYTRPFNKSLLPVLERLGADLYKEIQR